ncbi:MAG: hypothetical protein AAB262_04630 [Elusimicrobiota bacterium]
MVETLRGRIAVVDLRRPVVEDGLIEALRARPWDEVYAVTPLAAWLLEQADIPFKNNDALVDAAEFRASGLENFTRLEHVFRDLFGAERESWLGLLAPLKMLADYALAEELRRRSLEQADVHIFSDLPHPTRAAVSWNDHIYNRAALYFWVVPAKRHTLIRRRSELLPRLVNRLKRLTPAGLLRKLARLAPRGVKPGLVTAFAYDWAPLRPFLKSQFSSFTAAELAAEALVLGGAPADDETAARFRSALEEEFQQTLPLTLPHLLAIALECFARYALLRRHLSEHIPDLVKRHDLRGALSTFCGSPEEYLVNYFLKAQALPTVFYQHGGYMQHFGLTAAAETVPASHNLAYGSDDAAFLSGLRADGRVYRMGSTLLDELRPACPQKSRFLYVLLLNPGNPLFADGNLSYPLTDHTAMFRRHRRVLKLFARRPESTLVLRQHPAQYNWCLYEPLSEFIANCGIKNVSFDQSPLDPDRYFSGYEGIIMDYPCTGLLQAMAKGAKLACHIGDPFHVAPEGEPALRRAAACAADDDAFIALLELWITGELPCGEEAARAEYLSRHGRGLDPSLPAVRAFVEETLQRTSRGLR